MKSRTSLSVALLALALAATPAAADPDPRAPASAIVRGAAPSVASEAETYAAREAADRSVAEFRGGESSVVMIGTGTVTLILLVILIVILL